MMRAHKNPLERTFVISGSLCLTLAVGLVGLACRPADEKIVVADGGGSGGSGSGGHGGTGGTNQSGTGGASATGGNSGSGGQTAGSGGSTSSGGATATGGGTGSGGSAGGTAGRSGTGGAAGRSGSGGASGGTTGGSGGAAGSGNGTGGSGGPGTCTDDMMNGSETGVDCGGSCPACPNYKINPPNLKNNAMSGCQGGQGFMCTRSMVFSPEFKQAAMDDWSSGNPPFVYGVVGHDKDQGGVDGSYNNTCCQCYQLVFTSPRDAVTGLPTPKPMIVQTFNTAAGGGKNFDVYMATGGEGANTAGCSAEYSQFPSVGEPNNGGIRPLNFAQQCSTMNKYTEESIAASLCQDQISSQCMMIQASASASNQSASQVSCIESNQPANLYHLNWNVLAKRVECPANLTRVTGCKLASQGLPQADPTAVDSGTATNGFMSGYTTTTMQDCCRPTCGYSANVMMSGVAADSSYGAFYTCDVSGNPS